MVHAHDCGNSEDTTTVVYTYSNVYGNKVEEELPPIYEER